jgi:CubicO group peptidase (beta-lactamase class C family)
MDSTVLAEFVVEVAAAGRVNEVTVVRNGHVVLDVAVYPFPAGGHHNVFSVTKSVTATLIGIAIHQGLLRGVDVPVVEVLGDVAPAPVDELKASMTVEHLLTMASGLECRDSYSYAYEGLREMESSTDWSAHVLALPMSEAPGARFEYCNGVSLLLSHIISEVAGEPASEYAADVLFGPLGIDEPVWRATPQGVTLGYSDLKLTAHDMAKIGYLYLRGGEWEGDRLLSSEFVAAATSTQIAPVRGADGYGYQWWVDDRGFTMARGFGGQYVMVIPSHDLVVAFISNLAAREVGAPEALLADTLLGAVVADGPLSPSPAAEKELADAIAAVAAGPEPSSVDLPPIASDINGARYEYREGVDAEAGLTDLGSTWFSISFQGDSALMEGDFVDLPRQIEIGLDGRYRQTQTPGHTLACQGDWLADSHLRVECLGIDRAGWLEWRFSFSGAEADVVLRELTTAALDVARADRADP